MKFETEYKNINFHISLEHVLILDVSQLLGDKFNRLPNQTMIQLKKGNIKAYNLFIRSQKNEEERTHFWANVLLTSDEESLLEELGDYLEDEEILDSIISNWELLGDETGPSWK